MPYFFSLSLFIYLQISMAYLSNTLAMSETLGIELQSQGDFAEQLIKKNRNFSAAVYYDNYLFLFHLFKLCIFHIIAFCIGFS